MRPGAIDELIGRAPGSPQSSPRRATARRSLLPVCPGSREPVAWFTIDEQDRPAGRFWRYVAAAFGRAVPNLGDETTGAIDEWAVDGTDMASVLLAELGEDSPPMLLVLDDVHHITDPAIIDQLAFFLERTPASLRIIVVSRAELPLPVARWQAEGMATESVRAI